MNKHYYQQPEIVLTGFGEDVFMASRVVDDGDIGLSYDEIFGAEEGI